MAFVEFHRPDGQAFIVADVATIVLWGPPELGANSKDHNGSIHFINGQIRDVKETPNQISEMIRRAKGHA